MMLSDMIRCERGLYEFNKEMEHVGHCQQSNTLFPQRVHSNVISNAHFAFNGDNFQCGHKPKSMTCNSNVNQANGYDKSLELPLECSERNIDNLPSPASSLSKLSDQNSSKPESVTCFLCKKEIKTECIEEHLLISEVTCVKCSVLFIDCEGFKLWTVERAKGRMFCNHLLQYVGEPLETLKINLSAEGTKNGALKGTGNIDYDIQNFINGIKSLGNRYPWQQAISCWAPSETDKDGQLHHESGKLKSKLKDRSAETFDGEANQSITVDIGLSDLEKNGPSQDAEKNSPDTCFTVVGIVNNRFKGDPPSKQVNFPQGKNGHSSEEFTNMDSKTKKRKVVQSSTESKKKTKPRQSKNFIETPSSGFYYVVQHPVKECPNCYSAITAPDFTINIVTFLMTAICSGCGLTIYIVHDPPDESSARVCIVTDQKKQSNSSLL